MTNARSDLFQALAEMAQRYPELRIGQLVCNLADWSEAPVWDVEDEQLLATARDHMQRVPPRDVRASA